MSYEYDLKLWSQQAGHVDVGQVTSQFDVARGVFPVRAEAKVQTFWA